jgi:hypothetical protein
MASDGSGSVRVTVEAAAVTELMNGERNIGAVHANATVRVQSTECRFIGRHYRWPSMSALQVRSILVLIVDTRNQKSGARRIGMATVHWLSA